MITGGGGDGGGQGWFIRGLRNSRSWEAEGTRVWRGEQKAFNCTSARKWSVFNPVRGVQRRHWRQSKKSARGANALLARRPPNKLAASCALARSLSHPLRRRSLILSGDGSQLCSPSGSSRLLPSGIPWGAERERARAIPPWLQPSPRADPLAPAPRIRFHSEFSPPAPALPGTIRIPPPPPPRPRSESCSDLPGY